MSGNEKDEGSSTAPSDEELMRAYARGEYDAFEKLYNRHAKTVYGFLVKKLSNRQMADEVFQMSFMQLHRSRAKYNAGLPFLPWLFTLCRNALVDYVRMQKRIQEDPREDVISLSEKIGSAQPSDYTERSEALFNVAQWTEALSPKEREVLSLRFAEDFSFDEIGKQLRIRSSGARKISQRALQKLRLIWK